MINIKQIKNNEEVKNFMKVGEMQLLAQGYTEHSFRHVGLVSRNAGLILEQLGFSEENIELAKIAGYLHDIGNAVNRTDHAHTGAILAYDLLMRMGMSASNASQVMLAIGQHDEKTGTAVSPISAALILADKSDVHRSRVKNKDFSTFDIHDRVNYAVIKSEIIIDNKESVATLKIEIDLDISPVMDYFEIFLHRMSMCRRAAEFLNLKFQLLINEAKLL